VVLSVSICILHVQVITIFIHLNKQYDLSVVTFKQFLMLLNISYIRTISATGCSCIVGFYQFDDNNNTKNMNLNKSDYILTFVISIIIFNNHKSDANCKYDMSVVMNITYELLNNK